MSIHDQPLSMYGEGWIAFENNEPLRTGICHLNGYNREEFIRGWRDALITHISCFSNFIPWWAKIE